MSITVDRIMELAAEKGVTLEFLNDLIGGYKGKTIGWKTGRSTPTFSELTTLANYFNVPLDYLLGHSLHPDAPASRSSIKSPPVTELSMEDSYIHIGGNLGGRNIPIPPDKVRRLLMLIEAAFPELLE